jgi:phosphomannomutase
LAQKDCTVSALRATFPNYCISKNRIDLTPEIDVDKVLEAVKEKFAGERINDRDGVKIDFADGWVHLRKSNTEPIIRVYSEAATMQEADELANKVIDVVKSVVKLA